MNGGNSGIVPTIDLATNGNNNNGFAYPYPIYPMMGGVGGNGGFGSGFGDSGWIILLLLLAFSGNWGGNGNGGFFGGNSFDNGFAWLSNGQKEIMNNTNQGFDTLHLSNNIQSVHDGIYSLSNQLCNVGNDITSSINTTAYNAEIAANNRQMANMNQFFDLSRQFADCCCENRLATQDLKATVISENCADREALSNGIRDIITNQTANTQRVLDVICQNQITELRDKLADRDRELQTARFNASQIAQTAQLRADNVASNEALLNSLNTCPIPSTPVYGRTPIFSCNNNGCGCNNGFNQFI